MDEIVQCARLSGERERELKGMKMKWCIEKLSQLPEFS